MEQDEHNYQGNQDNTHLSLAEWRPRRLNIKLPKRFRDILPQPLPPLLESLSDWARPASITSATSLPHTLAAAASPSITLHVRKLFRTPQNVFGIFQQYHSEKLPTHDPEEHVELQDLCDDLISNHSSDPSPSEN